MRSAELFLTASGVDEPSPLSLFLKRKAEVDELPVKVEISRSIAAILRLIYVNEKLQLLDKLLEHPSTVEAALWDMVKQDQYPVVASEGWFALALLSREGRGAERVAAMLEFELLRKLFVEGQGRDRDNAGVLVVELKKNSGIRKAEVEELFELFLNKSRARITEIED